MGVDIQIRYQYTSRKDSERRLQTLIKFLAEQSTLGKVITDTLGAFAGDIEINSDDPDEDPYNWAIKGTIVEVGTLACSPLPRHGFLVPRRRSLHRLCNLNREYFDHRWVGIEKRSLEQQAEPAGGD